jgi:hypothetical protein
MLGMKQKSRNVPQPTIRIAVALVAAFALVASVASAQQAPPELKTLSLKKMVSEGERHLEGMKNVLKEGFAELRSARETQAVQKINQVNEALSTIKGLLRLSEQNFILLQEAAAKNRRDNAERELVKIIVAYDKVMELRGLIRAAGGPEQEGSFDGQPQVDIIRDSDVPVLDPIEDISALDVIDIDAAKPPPASPFF